MKRSSARSIVSAVALTLGAALVLGASPALAATTFFVDNDGLECPTADFTSIQAAVTAAGPEDKIIVCPGIYIEQVQIPAGKDGIELQSQVPEQAIIQAPPMWTDPDEKGIVDLDGAQDVLIRHFTIRGPAVFTGCADDFYGVLVNDASSAEITHNHITAIRDANPALRGCQRGNAVQVGTFDDGAPNPGIAIIRQNLIDDYQKTGVVVNEAGSFGEVRQNTITGSGPDPIIAQNGVQFGFLSEGEIRQNEISLNDYAGEETEAAGIILEELVGGVVARQNKLFLNGHGIVGESAFGFETPVITGVEISHNQVYENTNDAFWFAQAEENLVAHNLVRDNGGRGIHFESDTQGNRILHNQSTGNAGFDCSDDSAGPGTAGTANFWIKNLGNTENRPGLCKPKGGGA